ncbi:hypothetical protein [Cyanobium sp. N5-Cardenillas]|uniref:hypothetical protein n=1 Tax=Cyanobium sp. N5-Cardenillas TaxID=2823720 RepID=UPI0020CE9F2A|nr:hypothetical protein [Cyanobium sp. N5-Cardenillas]MCP9786397.1 glycosyltransferase family 39 protein [Cyanobium sp. N5-Cardenillas]
MGDTAPLPPAESHRARHLFHAALTGLLILFCLTMAGQGLTTAYSYWSDELWSVAASQADWSVLIHDWLIPDVHPPLYQLLLKLWIGVFGTGESATRSLSFLIAALGLVAAALCSSGRGAGRRLFTVAFLGTSPSFLFYAQETRSYALSLTLSTLMLGTALLLRQRPERHGAALRWGFRLASVLLSLTHYFSLLFVLVVLAVSAADGRVLRRRRDTAVLGLLLLVPPLAHGLASSIGAKFERIDWIEVTPITGTLEQFSRGLLPLLDLRQGQLAQLGLIALVVAVCCAFGSWRNLRRFLVEPTHHLPPALGEARYLLLVIGLFLALLLVIDPIKPLSQARYTIVVLPAVAYLVGTGWELSARLGPFRHRALAVLLATVLLLQLRIGQRLLAEKQTPLENYRAMAAFVNSTAVCEGGCWSTGWRSDALMGTYFRPGQLRDLEERDPAAPGPLQQPLLAFHGTRQGMKELSGANPQLACWEAPGAWQARSFILLPRTIPVQPARHGLRPCS